MSTLEARVSLINEHVQFRGVAGDNDPVIMDYIPPFGDRDGYMALELFLMSLATCAATAVVTLLRKMRRQVTHIEAHASGTRREEHPMSFTTIHLHFLVTSPDVTAEEIQNAINVSEQLVCPVWAMLKGNVTVTAGFEIVRGE